MTIIRTYRTTNILTRTLAILTPPLIQRSVHDPSRGNFNIISAEERSNIYASGKIGEEDSATVPQITLAALIKCEVDHKRSISRSGLLSGEWNTVIPISP
ncbi:hypothetical protein N7G274_009658 [Stereocaulon virgatum]|uniref:Uncharacterized protein n=1 Tax=Stereocaulon virgatum TaxID=373712 RepID=A0ABR3ZXU6_9LECA